MEFYKKRNFGELVSATFDFVKEYGKDFFKKYIVFNGLIIILLLVVISVGFKEFIMQIFDGNMMNQQFLLENYFIQNQEILWVIGILVFILFLLLSLVSYSLPVLYVKRIAETGAKKVSFDEMFMDIKAILPRFFKFFIGTMLIIVPIAAILMIFSAFLMFILIGFLLILLILPALMNFINFTLFHYYQTDSRFFDALGYAWNKTLSKDFWKYWGSAVIVYLIIQVITSVFTFIPMFLITGLGFLSIEDSFSSDGDVIIIFITILFYCISMIASLLLSNLIYINAGFMYYDSREDLHKEVQFTEIETIGKRAN